MWSQRVHFHFSVLVLNSVAIWYEYNTKLPTPEHAQGIFDLPLKGRFAFITNWSLVIQTIYYGIALLNDLVGSNEVRPKQYSPLRRLKDITFSVAFPLATLVCAMFWGIYSMDPEMILPKHLEIVYPKWLNHTQHTLIVPFILLELFTSYREYPSRKLGVTLIGIVTLLYIGVSHLIFYKTGTWAYPIFTAMNTPIRTVFFGINIGIVLGLYCLGEKLNSIAWPKKGSVKSKKN